MSSISVPGIGSGLDVQSIVSQLMDIERQPLQRLQIRQLTIEAQISAYGTLSGSLATFQDAMDKLASESALKIISATSSNPDVVTVSTGDSPELGSFSVEVVRLAEQHKLASQDTANTATFGGRGNDRLFIQVGTDPANTLTVNLRNEKTLAEIATAINTEPNNPGVTANILNVDVNTQKLILTSNDTGAENALSISTRGNVNPADFGFQTVNDIGGNLALLDSEVKVDGVSITRPNDEVSGVIAGVTLNLVKADPGNTHTIEIGRDIDALRSAVQSFADAFNTLRSQIRAFRDGELSGDNALLAIERRIFSVLNRSVTGGAYRVLSEVGLEMQREGNMTFDQSKLDAALEADYDSVVDLFAADGKGFANQLASLAEGWLGSDGLVDARQDGLRARAEDLIDRQIRMERNLELVESRYRTQFSALDTLVSQLQNTSQFLTSQLALLPSPAQGLNRNR